MLAGQRYGSGNARNHERRHAVQYKSGGDCKSEFQTSAAVTIAICKSFLAVVDAIEMFPN
jgi:hypothetical protein